MEIEGTEQEREMVCLISGGNRKVIPLEQIERLIHSPRVVPVPGAPGHIAGMMEFEGKLIAVYGAKTCGDQKTPGVAAVCQNGGMLWAEFAEEAAGGGGIDTVYGRGISES